MSTVEERFPIESLQTHVKKKDMWAGTHTPIESKEYMFIGGKVEQRLVMVPPSLIKVIDEVIVNALDHYINNLKNAHPVTYIKVCYVDGTISVENDGPGIPTDFHNGANMYCPQLIFGTMFSGSNLNKSSDSITGGTNGVGVKLTNILSSEFTVDTIYNGTHYVQTWKNGIDGVQKPTIKKSKLRDRTKFIFTPRYAEQHKYEPNDEFIAMLHWRTIMASIYASKCKVSFNGELCKLCNMQSLAKFMYPDAPQVSFKMNPKDKLPWDVVVVCTRNTNDAISNVNGIVATGSHIDMILKQITDNAKKHIQKSMKNTDIKFQPSFIRDNIIIYANVQILGVGWNSQCKDKAKFQVTKFKDYVIPPKSIGELNKHLTTSIEQNLYKKNSVIGLDNKKTRGEIVIIEKYTEAIKSRKPSEAHKCSLLLPEGDSAKSMCEKGLTGKVKGGKPLGFDYYGILTLRGVIINVRKEAIFSENGLRFKEKLANNIFFKNLLHVTGLDVSAKYDPQSPTYKSEKSKLKYGCIIGCVDQDHDGVGFIFSLIINIFDYFWPNLLKAGYIKRFITPVRRAYPRRAGKNMQTTEFFSENEYQKWLASDATHNEKNYHIVYIKGLASNRETDIAHMFQNFHKNLFTYPSDKETPKIYEDLFGLDADIRKVYLRAPAEYPDDTLIEQQINAHQITATDHARFEAIDHKRENLRRKLWSFVDGLNESGRKILAGSIKCFTNKTDEMSVANLAAYIQNETHYHYGSIADSIFGHGNAIVGGTQLPQVVPMSGFIDRNTGGHAHGAPRYAKTRLNKSLTEAIYPPSDTWVLDYRFDEGVRIEPVCFMPIIPMAVLESIEMPADGWKIKVWARDSLQIIDTVKQMIDTPDAKIPYLHPNQYGYKGKIFLIGSDEYSVGKYTFDAKTRVIHITELPLRTWPEIAKDNYNKKLFTTIGTGKNAKKVKMFKLPAENHSSVKDISIKITLAAPNEGYDPLDIIQKSANKNFDGFEVFFDLTTRMHHNLNMLAPDQSVHEFQSYVDIIKQWFPYRRDLYKVRILRELKILELKIMLEKEYLKYINKQLDVRICQSRKEADELLTEHKFIPLNISVINNPKYLQADEIEKEVHNNASFDYLLNLKDLDRIKSELTRRDQVIQRLEKEKLELETSAAQGVFMGAEIWKKELDHLKDMINEGRQTEWLYKDKHLLNY